jgi:hypothetical protein
VTESTRDRVGRHLAAASLALACGVVFVASSGGVVLGPLSIRSPRPLFVAACAAAALAWLAGGRRALADGVSGGWSPASRWPRVAVLVLAAVVLTAGVRSGSFRAGGADSSGYISQSRLWLDGRLTQHHELAARLRPWVGPWGFAPLGYRPGEDHGTIVPTYPPGYPLALAAVRAVGGERAAYLVVPLSGALLVWLAYLLGVRLADGRVGFGSALLLATSPTFLYQLVQPMSDIPAAAWWAAAALGCLAGTLLALLGGGVAASMAVLTRPNLVPLAAVLGTFVLVARGAGDGTLRDRLWRAAVFSAGVVPGCVAVAVLNDHLYGSPFLSGYGSADYLYDRANVSTNLHNYTRWLWDTQARVIWLAPLGLVPWLARRVAPGVAPHTSWLYAAMAAVNLAVYLPYAVFEDWSYLRFLLPGLPFFFALAATAVAGAVLWLPRPVAAVAGLFVLGAAGGVQLREAVRERVFDVSAIERRYTAIAETIPGAGNPEPLVLAAQHSGSLAYYTRAPILRWDLIDAAGLDAALALARADGRQALIVLDQHEEAWFRARFEGYPGAGRLDWPPRTRTIPPGDARVYAVTDRDRFIAGAMIPLAWVGEPTSSR